MMLAVTDAIILAGGMGTRLRDVVPDRPKPMALVNERPFLEYLLDYLGNEGVTRVALSVGYQWPQIKEYFGDHYRALKLDYVVEEQALGTGGALQHAINSLDNVGQVWVLNGDTCFPVPLAPMAAAHKGNGAALTMALSRQAICDRYGTVVLDERQHLVEFREKAAGRGEGLINGGLYLLDTVFYKEHSRYPLPFSLENELLPDWLAAGMACYGYIADAPFLDIGIPEDYRAAGEFMVKVFS